MNLEKLVWRSVLRTALCVFCLATAEQLFWFWWMLIGFNVALVLTAYVYVERKEAMKDKRIGVGEFAFWLTLAGLFAVLLVVGFLAWFSAWFIGWLGVARWLAVPLFVLLVCIWSGVFVKSSRGRPSMWIGANTHAKGKGVPLVRPTNRRPGRKQS